MSPRPVANILWEDLHPGLHLIDGDPPGAEPLVLYVGDDGVVRAAYNRCKHQGARLLPVRDCQLRCPRHGWQLDARQMSYDKPVGGIRHPELRVEREGAWVRIFDDALPEIEVARAQSAGEQPGAGSRSAHQQGAFTLRFYAHACLEVQAGNTRLFTDPWLQGPAFLRGWWLSHVPPRDWLAQLCASDGIFISHSHSDHLNPATLRALHDLRPDIPIYIPAFESQSCAHALQKLGFHNLHPCAFEQWHALAGGLRFMVLQDETCRDDSAILFAYGDCRVLNTVDCHNLSPSLLRRVAADAVDVLLTQFAGGASGFPVCWEELLGKDGVARIVKRNRVLARKQVLEWVERCKPAVYVPFANYFTEAHPSDREIQVTNVKNDVYEVCAAVQAAAPETRVWIPSPGATLDVMTRQITLPSLPSRARWAHLAEEDMERWTAALALDVAFAPLHSIAGLQHYFDWAAYRGDLLLHVIESSDDFSEARRAFWVDFLSGQVHVCRPLQDAPYLRMRVRQSVFRHVLRHGLGWEEVAIGFQARFYRDPDVYHWDFWHHFQNHLPPEPPQWNKANGEGGCAT